MKNNIIKQLLQVSLFIVLLFAFPHRAFGQTASLNYTITDNANWKQGQTVAATTVGETYSYNAATDTVSTTFTFNNSGFAPLPPMLALAYKYGLPIRVNKTVGDTGLTSVLGPVIGAQNTNTYTIDFPGLSHYVTSQRLLGTGLLPAGSTLQQDLDTEVNKIISAGHLRPALFLSNAPGCVGYGCPDRGNVYWYAPSDSLYYLSQIYPVLSSGVQSSLRTYIQNERTTYKPETMKSLLFNSGASRFEFDKSDSLLQTGGTSSWYNGMIKFRTQGNPKVYSLYGLSQYYDVIGATPILADITAFTTIVNNEMANRDWATLYWTSGNAPEYNAVQAVNQLFAGFVGYVRLVHKYNLANNNSQLSAENLGWGLLAKMATLRYAMGKYTQFEWDRGTRPWNIVPSNTWPAGLNTSQPDWWAKLRAFHFGTWAPWQELRWQGQLITFNWPSTFSTSDPYKNYPNVNVGIYNTRQVHHLNDTGVDTWEYYASTDGWEGSPGTGQNNMVDYVTYGPYLLPFADMVPELGRFMKDYLKPEVKMFADRVVENHPNWFEAYSEAVIGQEINYTAPTDSYGQFLADAWVLDTTPDLLYRYSDNSWLKVGDYFYLSKLAETIKSYKGISWSDAPAGPTPTPSSPTPTTPPACIADIDGSHSVGIGDLQMVLSNFGSTTNTQADINKDSKVNMLDAGYIIRYWGGSC